MVNAATGRAMVVGMTQRLMRTENTGEQRLALDVRWAGFLAACGIVGVPLPLEPELADATMEQTGCSGLLLTGGDDLADVDGAISGMIPERDQLERYLLERAIDRALPVVGVCRGMQLLVRSLGAELVMVDGHVATIHQLTKGFGGRVVNSFHRWAAVDVPSAFEVMAWRGAVIEAVRLRDAPAIGLMWHPERTEPVDQRDVALFVRAFRGVL